MPVQGPNQTYRDGFSMGGMSQVIIVLFIDKLFVVLVFVHEFIS